MRKKFCRSLITRLTFMYGVEITLKFIKKKIQLIQLDINDNLDLNVTLTKEKFNELCSDLFDKAMVYVDRALNMAKLSPNQLDYVVKV